MTDLPLEWGVLSLLPLLVLVVVEICGRLFVASWCQRRPSPEQRARTLLVELLSTEELRQLESQGYIMVPSPGIPERVYGIPAYPGTVGVFESGVLVKRLCVQPEKALPPADFILLLKLMIEGDEETYLRIAVPQQVQ